MNNREIEYKLEAVIDYLKKNGGYKHKLYNHCCPNMGYPDSNIVEYAEDIRDELFNTNDYQSFVINEICIVIKDNIKILLNNDKLSKLKEYCKNNEDLDNRFVIPYDVIIELIKETLLDLMTSPYLYDFRPLD